MLSNSYCPSFDKFASILTMGNSSSNTNTEANGKTNEQVNAVPSEKTPPSELPSPPQKSPPQKSQKKRGGGSRRGSKVKMEWRPKKKGEKNLNEANIAKTAKMEWREKRNEDAAKDSMKRRDSASLASENAENSQNKDKRSYLEVAASAPNNSPVSTDSNNNAKEKISPKMSPKRLARVVPLKEEMIFKKEETMHTESNMDAVEKDQEKSNMKKEHSNKVAVREIGMNEKWEGEEKEFDSMDQNTPSAAIPFVPTLLPSVKMSFADTNPFAAIKADVESLPATWDLSRKEGFVPLEDHNMAMINGQPVTKELIHMYMAQDLSEMMGAQEVSQDA